MFRGLARPPMEIFSKIVNEPLPVVTKLSILDVCEGTGYASNVIENYLKKVLKFVHATRNARIGEWYDFVINLRNGLLLTLQAPIPQNG